jgi:hypothetical protein
MGIDAYYMIGGMKEWTDPYKWVIFGRDYM